MIADGLRKYCIQPDGAMSRLLQLIMLILIFHLRVTRSPFETTDKTTGLALPRPISMYTGEWFQWTQIWLVLFVYNGFESR